MVKEMDGWMKGCLFLFRYFIRVYILTFVNQGGKTLDRPSENQLILFWGTGALDNVFE